MTPAQLTALVLLYRACPDEALCRRVLALVPGLDELVVVTEPRLRVVPYAENVERKDL